MDLTKREQYIAACLQGMAASGTVNQKGDKRDLESRRLVKFVDAVIVAEGLDAETLAKTAD